MITTTQRPPTVAVMPGAAAVDYFSTPDSAALDIVNGIEIVAKLTPVRAWDRGTIFAKIGGAGQRSYGFALDSTKRLGVWISGDGTVVSADLTAVLDATFSAGSTHWVRWVRDTGFSLFYTAPDQLNEPLAPPYNAGFDPSAYGLGTFSGSAGWKLMTLGFDGGYRGDLFSSTVQGEVGCAHLDVLSGLDTAFEGTIHRVIVRFDGATVCDFNPQDATVPASSWVSRQTGETWTKNGAVSLSPPDQVSTAVSLGRKARTTTVGSVAFATVAELAKRGDTTTAPGVAAATAVVCGASGRTTTMLGLP